MSDLFGKDNRIDTKDLNLLAVNASFYKTTQFPLPHNDKKNLEWCFKNIFLSGLQSAQGLCGKPAHNTTFKLNFSLNHCSYY